MDVFSNLLYLLFIGVIVFPDPASSVPGAPAPSPTTETLITTQAPTTELPIPSGPGIAIYDDCVSYHQNGCPSRDSPYFIKARNLAGYERESDICKTEGEIPSCSGEGWTSIGSLANDLWNYDSHLWTAKGTNQIALNSQFWSANVTEICLTSGAFNIQIPVAARSLRSLFFEKRILNMTPEQWINAITVTNNANFTQGCFEIGFNVGSQSRGRARLGIVTTYEQAHCPQDIVYMVGVGLEVNQTLTINQGYYDGQQESPAPNVAIYVRSRYVDESELPTTQTTESSTTTATLGSGEGSGEGSAQVQP